MNVMKRIIVGPARFVPAGSTVQFSRYTDGDHTCICLIDPATGEPATKVTVNIPENPPASKFLVWTKGWAENLGIPRACEKAGVFELLPEFHVIEGVIEGTTHMAQLARLTPKAIEQMNSELQS